MKIFEVERWVKIDILWVRVSIPTNLNISGPSCLLAVHVMHLLLLVLLLIVIVFIITHWQARRVPPTAAIHSSTVT